MTRGHSLWGVIHSSDTITRNFARGVTCLSDVYECITMQDWGGVGACFLRKILEIRCSEIASEAIWGQKQSSSSSLRYMGRGVLYQIFGCMHVCIC